MVENQDRIPNSEYRIPNIEGKLKSEGEAGLRTICLQMAYLFVTPSLLMEARGGFKLSLAANSH
jgi:hypothetical protein